MAREFRAVSINAGPRQCSCPKCRPIRAASAPSLSPIRLTDLRTLAALPNAPAYAAGLIAGWERRTPQEQRQLIAQIGNDMTLLPPEPVSLVDAIRAKKGLSGVPTPPIFGGGERPMVAARAADAVDDPPSLIDLIQSSRRR